MLGDPAGGVHQGLGMDFSAPPAGLIDRSKRYAMLVEDGTVTLLHVEENPGACEVSAGEGCWRRCRGRLIRPCGRPRGAPAGRDERRGVSGCRAT